MRQIVFAWNYTPDPSISPVRRAVQAYITFEAGGAWRWSARRVEFYVDGRLATPQQAVERLREVPVLTWAHPYHFAGVLGAPPEFSTEGTEAIAALVKSAYDQLVEAGLSPRRKRGDGDDVDDIHHITDFERFAPYDKASLVAGSAFAVTTDHASTACHEFGEALRRAGFDGPAANYATCHAEAALVAGGGNNRATPNHVPGSMDGRTTFLSFYVKGGPGGCLLESECLDAIAKCDAANTWIAVEDYQPGRATILREAKLRGVKLIALWGTENDPTLGVGANNRANAQWSRKMDAAIAGELR